MKYDIVLENRILADSNTAEEAGARLMLEGITESLNAGMVLWDMRDAAKKTQEAAEKLTSSLNLTKGKPNV